MLVHEKLVRLTDRIGVASQLSNEPPSTYDGKSVAVPSVSSDRTILARQTAVGAWRSGIHCAVKDSCDPKVKVKMIRAM